MYRSLQIGSEGDEARYMDPFGYPYLSAPGTTNRVQLHFPAPPAGVDTVTFTAGPFGDFEDVPLE